MIQVGDLPAALALKPDGSQLWVVNQNSDSVTIIDPVADVVLATISLGQKESFGSQETTKQSVSPAAIDFSLDGRFAYVVGSNSNRLMVIDTAIAVTDLANTIPASLEVGEKPVALAVHPTGSVVYVVNRGGGNLSVVDVSVPEIPMLLSQMPVGKTPEGIALLPNETKLYVTNSESNTVSVLKVESGSPYLTMWTTIPVGKKPSGVAVTRPGSFVNGDYVYVANRDDGTVSVIDAVTDTIVPVIDVVNNAVVPAIPVGKGPKGVAAGIIPTAP